MILVTGATGGCGRNVVAELKAAGVPVRAMTHDPEKVGTLEQDGVEVVVADMARPETLGPALDGVEGVFLVSSQHPDQAVLQGNVVEAARAAGSVRHIVKVSGGSGIVAENSTSYVGRAHWRTEQDIKASGLPYTMLRPNYFMQNLLMLAAAVKGGKLPLPIGMQQIAPIDVRDIAAVGARALTEDGRHAGQTYDLSGPELLTGTEMAERFSQALGREISHVSPPVEVVVEGFASRGAPEWLQQHFRELIPLFQQGSNASKSDTVEAVTGHRARSVTDFVQENAQAFS